MTQNEFIIWLRGFLDGMGEPEQWHFDVINDNLQGIKESSVQISSTGTEVFEQIKPELDKMITIHVNECINNLCKKI